MVHGLRLPPDDRAVHLWKSLELVDALKRYAEQLAGIAMPKVESSDGVDGHSGRAVTALYAHVGTILAWLSTSLGSEDSEELLAGECLRHASTGLDDYDWTKT